MEMERGEGRGEGCGGERVERGGEKVGWRMEGEEGGGWRGEEGEGWSGEGRR